MHISEASCPTPSVGWVHAPYLKFVVWPELVDLGLHCWLHVCLYIPAWASMSVITCRGGSSRTTSNTTVGVIFITPVIARQAVSVTLWALSCGHCIRISATKLWTCRSLWVWAPWCRSHSPPWALDQMFNQMCPSKSKESCKAYSSHFSSSMSISCPEWVQGIWPQKSAAQYVQRGMVPSGPLNLLSGWMVLSPHFVDW